MLDKMMCSGECGKSACATSMAEKSFQIFELGTCCDLYMGLNCRSNIELTKGR